MIPQNKILIAGRRVGKTAMTRLLLEAQHGMTLSAICAAAGVSRATYFRLRHMSPSFAALMDRQMFGQPNFRGLPK